MKKLNPPPNPNIVIKDGRITLGNVPALYYKRVVADPNDPANDHEPYWCLFTLDRVQFGGSNSTYESQEELEREFKSLTLERKTALCEQAIEHFKLNKRVYLLALNKVDGGYQYLNSTGGVLHCSVTPQAFSQSQLLDLVHDRAFKNILLEYGAYDDIRVLNASVLFNDQDLTDLFSSLYRGFKAFV